MKTLTVRVCETPKWLAHRCREEAELSDMTACPFAGASCTLGLVSCGRVTPKDWEEVLGEEPEEEEDEEEAHVS